MKIKVSVLFSISFLLMAAPVQSATVLRPNVPAGRWKVGYRIVTFHDPERDGRPVQLTVWYPARPAATSPRVLFRTYVDSYFVPETGGAPNPTEREADYSRQTFPDAAKDDVLRLLNSETTSYQDASPTPGKYPVVLFATGGGGTPLTHAPTCELLASYGYYVFTVPSIGREGIPAYLDAITLDQKVRDLETAFTLAKDYPYADFSQVVAGGFSLGGGTAIVFAQRHPGVKGVISLDGSFGFEPYLSFHGNNGPFEEYRVRCPLVHINVAGYPYNDLHLVDALVFSDRVVISLPNAAHHSFVAGDLIASIVRGSMTQEYRAAYEFICKSMIDFVGSTVGQGRPWDMARFRSTLQVPQGAAINTYRAMSAPPLEPEIYTLLLSSGGIGKLRAEYDAVQKLHPSVRFARESVIEAAATQLRLQHRLDEAVAACEWNVQQYPGSWRAENALAAAFKERNDIPLAVEHYRRSLTLQKNMEAQMALQKMSDPNAHKQ